MTLYDQLGEVAIQQLVDSFYEKVFADDRMNFLFQNTEMEEIKRKQSLFLIQFLGGPSYYSEEFGHPRMRLRHMPHRITPAAAEAWLENMLASIKSLDIADDLKVSLYNRFPMVAAHMVNSEE